MAPNFSKNAILEGTVDYFCLVCESYFQTAGDTEVHITEAVHQKNLNAVQYVAEFKTDKIKKIKHGYFCELCNKLLTVLTRVRLHVTEPMHNDRKHANLFKRVGDCIVALESVVISDESWNGLIENSCTVCNSEYDNKEMHKKESSHILNVMQKKVEVDKNRNIYRTIDEYSFQCLTCNTILLSNMNTLNSHFDGNEHKNLHQACCDAYKIIILQAKETCKTKVAIHKEEYLKSKDDINGKENKSDDNNLESKKNEVKSLVPKLQKDETKMKKESQVNELHCIKKSTELKEQMSKIVPKNSNDEKGNDNVDKLPQTKFEWDYDVQICKAFGANDYIILDLEGKLFCILCEWPVEDLSHITGKHHQTILKMHKNRLEKNKSNYISNTSCNNTMEKDTSKILESIDEFQKNYININFETKAAFCKKCVTNVELDYEAIKIHISEHKKKSSKKNKIPIQFEAGEDKITDKKNSLYTKPVFLNHPNSEVQPKSENLEKTKGLTNSQKGKLSSPENLDRTSSNVEKSLQTKEGSTLKVDKFKETDKVLECSSTKPSKSKLEHKKIQFVQFVESSNNIQCMMFHDAVINNKICININSFHYTTSTEGNILKCHICDEYVLHKELEDHWMHPKHFIAIVQTQVIIYEDSEFIRENKAGKYHCGYCNLIVSSWDNMETHLKLCSHIENKRAATWRLEQYKLAIANDPSSVINVDSTNDLMTELKSYLK